MFRPRWLQSIRSLGLEFWLPLPLLGLFFWVGGGLLTDRMLSRSYNIKSQFQLDMQRKAEPPKWYYPSKWKSSLDAREESQE